ncbi:uncharacterized protein N7515_008630 [Penicillium bovifimosum]|uniref:Uncharacterized protein n=1 Tax=Penicillium bovifimosum TaxID=126998 RepID=A0A9W9GNB4_9EURO|nr:uncharacterized protein N7515_008630 [Penicillium bovifimosum]KAJ5124805.1 hypothetical protein N7515_008630 [Penicillium bovifimosum]
MPSSGITPVMIPITAAGEGDMSTWPSSRHSERDDRSWRRTHAKNWRGDGGAHEEALLLRFAFGARHLGVGHCVFGQL